MNLKLEKGDRNMFAVMKHFVVYLSTFLSLINFNVLSPKKLYNKGAFVQLARKEDSMKRYHVLVSAFIFATLFLLACQLISLPLQATAESTTEPVKSTDLETQTLDSSIPVTGNLDGPPMELGATFPYVDGTLLVAVPEGEFIMGNNGAENPEHTVMLSDFWIYSTTVTNQQYKLCITLDKCSPPNTSDDNGYSNPARANDPVVGVSYDQAADYCGFVNARLPTEAEWEKAARGPNGNIYPWGETTPSCDLLNFNNCVGMTTNVVSYPSGASYYGGLEFAGNTFEWVADWYDPQYYNNSPTENPTGPDTGKTRSVRSSGYDSDSKEVTLSNRYFNDPEDYRQNLGFRCVVENPAYFAPFCESTPVYGLDSNGIFTAQDTGPSENCPELDIFQVGYCSNKVSAANVTFSGPPESVIDPGNCIPSGDPALFVCQSPGTVSITAECQVNIPGTPACPAGYIMQGNACVGEGNQGECLVGWEYDPELQCCASSSGFELNSDFPLCPSGSFYAADQNAGLPYPAHEIVSSVSISQDIRLGVCGGFGKGGGGGGGSDGGDGGQDVCQPQRCRYGSWDSSQCCCTYREFGCYP